MADYSKSSSSSNGPSLNQLCRTCKAVLIRFAPVRSESGEPESFLFESTENIYDSASSCRLCSRLLSRLLPNELPTLRRNYSKLHGDLEGTCISRYFAERSLYGDVWPPSRLIYKHNLDNMGNSEIQTSLGFVFAKNIDIRGPRGELPGTYGSSTGSRQSLDMARKWLQNCLEKHFVHHSPSSDPLPTRLIDTGPPVEPAQPRLCQSVNLPRDTQYATLSHCWGKFQPTRLLQAEFTNMMLGLNMAELPLTFRDAITVARHLDLRYIWIDSLCIIQDSEEDWQRESALMEIVYANSTCNIAAEDAEDSNQGLFRSRDPQDLRPLKVQVGQPDEGFFYYVGDQDWWTDDVSRSLLSQRGWVVQERLFSPRVLHFGSQQIYWECRDQFSCETFPSNLSRSIHIENFKPRFHVATTPLTAIHMWHKIISNYTSKFFTRETDKLVAISSLAAKVQHYFASDYVAGLWNRDIIHQLLWRVTPSTNNSYSSVRYTTFVAPSWSWASVQGRIEFLGRYVWFEDLRAFQDLVSNIDISVELVSDEQPFGQVKSGRMTLEGRLFDATSLVNKEPWVAPRSSQEFNWANLAVCPDEIDSEIKIVEEIGEDGRIAATKYYCLPLRRHDNFHSSGPRHDSRWHGLILRHVPQEDGTIFFSRWGLSWVDGLPNYLFMDAKCGEFDSEFQEGSGLTRVWDKDLVEYRYQITIT